MRLAAIVLAACAAQSAPLSMQVQALSECAEVTNEAELRFALTTSNCIHIGDSTIVVDTPVPAPGSRRPFAMFVVPSTTRIYGDGATSVVRFVGDAGGRDWAGFQVAMGAADNTFEGFVIESRLTNTVEQTHAIFARGPIARLTVQDMTIDHPVPSDPALRSGDCIKAFGYPPGELVTDLIVRRNKFICARSALGSSSGAVRVEFSHNVVLDNRAQAVDQEPGVVGTNTDWTIADNRFESGPSAAGSFAMQLVGVRVNVARNILNGRGIVLYSCESCTLEDNTIVQTAIAGQEGVIEVMKNSPHFTLRGGSVSRMASAGPGPVVRVVPHGTQTPSDVRIEDVALLQMSGGVIMYTEGIVGLTVARNDATYAGPPVQTRFVNAMASVATRTTDILVSANRVHGPIQDAVVVSSSRAGTGSVTVELNTSDGGVVHGLRCDSVAQGNKVLGPVYLINDSMPRGVCGPPGFVIELP